MEIKPKIDKGMNRLGKYDGLILRVLMVLMIINYMVVTIIMNDFALVKFIRDILLIILVVLCLWNSKTKLFRGKVLMGLFMILCVPGMLRADSFSLGFTVLRRYLFPLVLFAVVTQMDMVGNLKRFLRFIAAFFAVMSVWGIFQAHVLGDEFLMDLGYPVQYSYYYQQDMLYNSYYFGGFGIQRVVMTLSNSNVCGLILGCTLILLVINYQYFADKKYTPFLILAIAAGYVLTFSRSNFLALIIVVILFAIPYIPNKKYFLIGGGVIAAAALIIGVIQGQDGIVYKLLLWVRDSLTFTESSAAGRSSRWLTALDAVLKNPFGIGFGHVGSLASEAGVVEGYYSCENSYLAIALDNGWLGLILYCGFIATLVIMLRRHVTAFRKCGNTAAERLCMSGFIIIMYFLIVFFFSNHIYDMEAMSVIYIYIAMILNLAESMQPEQAGAVHGARTDSGITGKIRNKLTILLENIRMAFCSLFWKRRKDTVLFGAWFGDKFADNSRFLYQYLSENKEDLGLSHVVWVTRNQRVCDLLRSMGYEAYMMESEESIHFHKTSCMHVVCNSTSDKNGTIPDIDIRYSFGAKRINLWHGVGVVKGVGCASKEYRIRKENNKLVYAVKEALEKIKVYRMFVTGRGGWGEFYFLSPTEAATRQFEQFSYVPRKNFIHTLYPRTCACPQMTVSEQQVVERMKEYDKVVMYLPTFRTGSNSFDFSDVAEQMNGVLEEENILWIQKAHSASGTTLAELAEGHILNLPPEFDINVVMPYISLLITDYSSAASDARFFRKPVLFYVPDLDEYMNGDNGVTEEAEELMRGPQFFGIDELRQGLRKYIQDPESAKPDDFEDIRKKYWGEEMDMAQIWSDILQATGLNSQNA